jgi:hypothetical protein
MSTGSGVVKRVIRGRKKELYFLVLCLLLPLAGLLPQRLFDWIVSFPLVGIYIASAYLAGTAVLYGFRIFEENPPVSYIIRILSGFGVFSLYFMLLGILGLARHLIISYLTIIFLLSVYVLFRKTREQKENKDEVTASLKKKNGVVQKKDEKNESKMKIAGWIACIIIFISIAAVFLLVPIPEGFHDSLLYHLAIPQQMFITGKLAPMEHNFTSYLPLNSEMLYLPLAANDYAARLLQFAFAMMTLGLVTFSVPKKNRILAGFICLSGFGYFEFLRTSITVLPEINVAAYAVAGWLLLEHFMNKQRKAYLLAAGAMFGFAAGTKYQGLVIAGVSAAAYLCVAAYRKQGIIKPLISAVLMLLVTFLVFSPWMIKSFLLTGDPVFPAGYSVFGAKNIIGTDINTIISIWNYKSPDASGAIGFILMPFKQVAEAGGTASLVFLLLPLPFILLKRKEGFAGPMIALICFYTAWWLLAPHPRYFVPAIPLILLLGARTVTVLGEYKKWRLLFVGLAVIIFAFNFIPSLTSLYNVMKPLDFYRSGLDRAAYEERLSSSPFAAFCFINENTPKTSKILLIGESRGYNLKRPYHSSSPYERQLITDYLDKYKTAEELRAEMQRAGFNYILVNFAEWKRTRDMLKIPVMDFAPKGSQKSNLFVEFIRSLASIYSDKRCVIYRL